MQNVDASGEIMTLEPVEESEPERTIYGSYTNTSIQRFLGFSRR